MKFGWPFMAIFAILSFVSLIGKGSFLLFGMKEATKKQYNLKRYSRIYGVGFGLIAMMFAASIYMDISYELKRLLNLGISLVLLATALAVRKFARNC